MNLTDIEAFALVLGWGALMVFVPMLLSAVNEMLENRKGKHCPYCGERH